MDVDIEPVDRAIHIGCIMCSLRDPERSPHHDVSFRGWSRVLYVRLIALFGANMFGQTRLPDDGRSRVFRWE